jgi:transcriptional regulator GlxA family with amidase domain
VDDVGVHRIAPAGAAGLLRGKRATTHWTALDALRALDADVVSDERVVFDGKIVTAAGVSAGIDMTLALATRVAGVEVAQSIQLDLEYDLQPPHDTGSTAKAPPRDGRADTRRQSLRPRYFTRRDIRRSASGLPPVWHAGQ